MYKNIKITILSHILVWFALFSMPYLLSYGQEQEMYRVIARFWIPLLFSAVIFYLNYFVLIDWLLFPKKMVLFILINSAIIIFFLILKEYIENQFFQSIIKTRPKNEGEPGPPFKMSIYIQMLSYLAPLLFSIALKATQRWTKIEAEHTEAANMKLQSELQHLHYQLQPHFFFNSLNNIYSLVDHAPEQAKTSIHGLSKLMRYMLYETNMERVPLSKEIDFMKKYIDLMKLRVSDKTTVNYDFPNEGSDILIAPLLFISLIENAFKHGISASKASTIEISIRIEEKKVMFTTENDNFPKKTEDKSGSGIGLPNIEKRLKLLYPNSYNFNTAIKDDRFVASLEINTQ